MFCKYKILKFQIPLIIILSWLLSCTSKDHNSNNNNSNNDPATPYNNYNEFDKQGINYKVPSPMELFLFLENNNAPFLIHKIHEPNNTERYSTTKSIALNFGIYSADLAYCSVFGDYQRSITYIGVAKNLAGRLGLTEGYSETLSTRINQNISNIDSLIDISNESYYIASQILSEQGQNDILGYVLVGGWIEAFYLTVHSMDTIDTKNPIMERVADQSILLENLLGHLHHNENSEQITQLIKDLEQVQNILDPLYFNNPETIITKDQFVSIANEISLLRNTYIN